MRNTLLLLPLFVFGLSFAQDCPTPPSKVVVCYYSSWSYYRENDGHFNLTHIDPKLCTHLVYTFAGLDLNSRITSLDPGNDITRGTYNAFTGLKEANPCLKTILAIGGWNEGSKKYSVMAYTKESRETFADSVLRFLVAYNFDGVDFDWEYPTQRGGLPQDKANFVELVKALHDKLKIWGLTISLAVPLATETAQQAYDIASIIPYLDYVTVMAYDATSGASKKTGLSTPLPLIKTTVDWWLQRIPANKLVLGIATYGRSFILENPTQTGIGAAVVGPGEPGMFTKEAGFLSYYEVLARLSTNRFVMVLTSDTYYAYYENEWFTFDLVDTYAKKIQYAKEKNLRGLMVWAIDTDDFLGKQSSGKPYPVLGAINRLLFG